MTGLIYFTINPTINFEFRNKQEELGNILSNVAWFEFDNFSDQTMEMYASKFIDECDTLIMVIEIASDDASFNILSLINKLQKKDASIFIKGSHPKIELLLKPFKKVIVFNNQFELKEKLSLIL